jgi:hypothetical protein
LVEKRSEPWMKSRSDFLAATENDGLGFEVTEIKT